MQSAPPDGQAEKFRPTWAVARIASALTEHESLSQRRLRAAVGGKTETVASALDLLILDGYVSEKTPHELLKPYIDGGDSQ